MVNYWKARRGKQTAIDHIWRFIKWREKAGYSTDPEQWVEECISGTNLTKIQHLKILKEWCEGEELDGTKDKYRMRRTRSLIRFS